MKSRKGLIKALALTVQKLSARLKFSKKLVELQGPGHRLKKWYPRKGLITGNFSVKYQSSSTRCSKVISKVKVSERTE